MSIENKAARWIAYARVGYPVPVRDLWASDERIIVWEHMIAGKRYHFKTADDAMGACESGDLCRAIPFMAARGQDEMDIAVLEHALTAVSRAFDEFVGECSLLGKASQPSQKALMKARAALPPYCTHAFKPKEPK